MYVSFFIHVHIKLVGYKLLVVELSVLNVWKRTSVFHCESWSKCVFDMYTNFVSDSVLVWTVLISNVSSFIPAWRWWSSYMFYECKTGVKQFNVVRNFSNVKLVWCVGMTWIVCYSSTLSMFSVLCSCFNNFMYITCMFTFSKSAIFGE